MSEERRNSGAEPRTTEARRNSAVGPRTTVARRNSAVGPRTTEEPSSSAAELQRTEARRSSGVGMSSIRRSLGVCRMRVIPRRGSDCPLKCCHPPAEGDRNPLALLPPSPYSPSPSRSGRH